MIRSGFGCLRWLAPMVVASLLGVECSQPDQSESRRDTSESLSVAEVEPFDSVVIELRGVDSLSVFDILNSTHEIDYFTTAAGVFVKAIDSLESDNDFFWIYSVNDVVPQVACDKYLTSDGDIIRWYYRSIEP